MILITGGAGYIGAHCALKFTEEDIIIFDNLSTGHIETVDVLQKLNPKVKFIKGDLKNKKDIDDVFKKNKIDTVFHFASYSIVEDSFIEIEKYKKNNIYGTKNLLNSMVENNVLKIIFSSSAAVYGRPKYLPIDEEHPLNPINPYGKTKLEVEKTLKEFDEKYGLKSIILRYFNVIGADELSRIGEWHEKETHLIPNILKSICENNVFKIYGNDYSTPDGTCIRDYIDVLDLIEAHRCAYLYLNKENKSDIFNLGSKGYSVLEIVETIKKIINCNIKYEIMPKRKGDPEILLADSLKAKNILNWEAKNSLEESILNAYKYKKASN